MVAALTTSRPKLIFYLFGKKALLGETLFWRRVLARSLFVALVDFALKILFGWDTANIDNEEKPLLYSYIYSTSSVKSVVQWFQITNTGRFQVIVDLSYKCRCMTNKLILHLKMNIIRRIRLMFFQYILLIGYDVLWLYFVVEETTCPIQNGCFLNYLRPPLYRKTKLTNIWITCMLKTPIFRSTLKSPNSFNKSKCKCSSLVKLPRNWIRIK